MPMDWPTILGKLASGTDLSRDEARAAMSEVMGGTASPAQISALIVSLRMKGETVEEMTGLVEAIKSAAVPVPVDADGLVDVVGTGGDRSGTFNISTTAALIAAGAGVRVAKHGNRSSSSKCGSADVLEGLGVNINLPVESNLALLADTGFAFFFAPLVSPLLSARRSGAAGTGDRHRLQFPRSAGQPGRGTTAGGRGLGSPDGRTGHRSPGEPWIRVLVRLLRATGEWTRSRPAVRPLIYRLMDGEITHAEFTPEDFGVERSGLDEIQGGGVQENVAILAGSSRRKTRPVSGRSPDQHRSGPGGGGSGVADSPMQSSSPVERSTPGLPRRLLDRVVARSRDLSTPED